MIYWMYSLPIWLFGILTVLVFCSFGIAGLAATRKWAPSLHHGTGSHNDIVGYYFGAITLLYGITLGLLMVGDWSTLTDTHEVIDVAWPEQQRGIIPRGNVLTVVNLATDLATFEPSSEEQKVLHAETYNRFNELVERRRSRLLRVTAGLSGALLMLVLIGAAINIGVTCSFHLHNQKMHSLMTAMTSSLLGLMIFLLAAMDHPYLGKISVSLEP